MPFYIRKSVSAGPFRFNFSKGGLGVSVGVKGLRIGTGPRGHYIHAGRGGLYYRATLGSAGGKKPSAAPNRPVPRAEDSGVVMVEVDSGDVMQMRDESFSELLDEINSKTAQVRMSAALAWTAIVSGALGGLASGGPGLLLCALAAPGWAIGRWFDSYRRSTVLYYDLEGDAEAAYNQLVQGFETMNGCAGKWHIEAGGAIQSLAAWKRNAGASHLVNRKATTLAYNLPSVIKSNVTPPAIHVGRQIMFFMPDVVFIQDGKRIGVVGYSDLRIRWQDSRFIETERVPSDARIVDHTWKHPNKSGGPDRRFKDNRQIPVCLYESVHFQSDSGVNELVEFSRTGITASFADGCRKLGSLPRERKIAIPAPTQNEEVEVVPTAEQPRNRRAFRTVAWLVLGLFVGLPVVGMIFGSEQTSSTSGSSPVSVKTSAGSSDVAPANSSPPTAYVPLSHEIRANAGLPAAPAKSPDVATGGGVVEAGSVAAAAPVAEQQEARSASDTPNTSAVGYTSTAVNLRKGPSTRHAIVSVIQKGVRVSVLKTEGNWSHVLVGEDFIGWMANSTISITSTLAVTDRGKPLATGSRTNRYDRELDKPSGAF